MQPDRNLYKRIAIRTALIVCAVVLVLTVGVWLFWLLLPFLLAYFFAWLLDPIVSSVCRKTRLPKKLTSMVIVAAAFLLVLALVAFLVWLAASEIIELMDGWQELLTAFEAAAVRVRSQIVLPFGGELLHRNVDDLLNAARTALAGMMQLLSQQMIALAADAAKMLPTALLFLIALVLGTYFILGDYEKLHDLVGHTLRAEEFRPIRRILSVLRQAFGGYLMTSFALAVMVSLINLAGLLLLRSRYAAILALLMGVLDFLPYVGSGAVLIPWSVSCFYTGDWLRGLYLCLLYLVIFFARNVAGRRLMGAKFRRSPFFGLVCSFIGWKLWGVFGLILGPVLCMIAINLHSSGLLDRTLADFRMLFADLRVRLGGGTQAETAPEDRAHNAQETDINAQQKL